MRCASILFAILVTAIPFAAPATAAPEVGLAVPAAGGPDIQWKAPTNFVSGGAYTVHVDLTAPVGGTVVAGWLLTPAAFTADGKSLADREDKGSMSLPQGAKLSVDIDLGPYLKVDKDFQLAYASGMGDDRPVAVKVRVPASAGLNFMDEKSVPLLDLKKYNVLLQTNRGDMVVEFWPEAAPQHVRNFLDLAYTDFYAGTTFHRVIQGFMIQGGDPQGTGAGNGPRMVKAEFNDRKHERGVLSMARQGDRNFAQNPKMDPKRDTASCQFFIMHAANPSLDGGYSAFGKLISGFDTLDAIATTATAQDRPKEDQKILKATVVHAEQPQ